MGIQILLYLMYQSFLAFPENIKNRPAQSQNLEILFQKTLDFPLSFAAKLFAYGCIFLCNNTSFLIFLLKARLKPISYQPKCSSIDKFQAKHSYSSFSSQSQSHSSSCQKYSFQQSYQKKRNKTPQFHKNPIISTAIQRRATSSSVSLLAQFNNQINQLYNCLSLQIQYQNHRDSVPSSHIIAKTIGQHTGTVHLIKVSIVAKYRMKHQTHTFLQKISSFSFLYVLLTTHTHIGQGKALMHAYCVGGHSFFGLGFFLWGFYVLQNGTFLQLALGAAVLPVPFVCLFLEDAVVLMIAFHDPAGGGLFDSQKPGCVCGGELVLIDIFYQFEPHLSKARSTYFVYLQYFFVWRGSSAISMEFQQRFKLLYKTQRKCLNQVWGE